MSETPYPDAEKQCLEWLERIIHTPHKDQLPREQALAAAGREARSVFEACLRALTERERLTGLLKRCSSDPDLFEEAILGRPPRWRGRALTDHPAEPSGDDVVAGESAPSV
jgi:hypothetical protein